MLNEERFAKENRQKVMQEQELRFALRELQSVMQQQIGQNLSNPAKFIIKPSRVSNKL